MGLLILTVEAVLPHAFSLRPNTSLISNFLYKIFPSSHAGFMGVCMLSIIHPFTQGIVNQAILSHLRTLTFHLQMNTVWAPSPVQFAGTGHGPSLC